MNAKEIFRTMLVLSLAFFPSAVWGATSISGAQSGTLTLANSPYLVTGDISVPGGQMLTIEDGVVLQFQDVNAGAIIDGTLIARGTSGSPIVFTSDEAAKQPGQWNVLWCRSTTGPHTILENCTVECAGAGGFAENIRVDGPVAPLFPNCTVRLAAGNGLTLLNADPRVQDCAFNNNANFAVAMRTDSLPVLRNSSASG